MHSVHGIDTKLSFVRLPWLSIVKTLNPRRSVSHTVDQTTSPEPLPSGLVVLTRRS